MYYFSKTTIGQNQFDILKNEISNNNTQSPNFLNKINSFDISNNKISKSHTDLSNIDILNNKISNNNQIFQSTTSSSTNELLNIYVFNNSSYSESNFIYQHSSFFYTNDVSNTSIDNNTTIPVNTIELCLLYVSQLSSTYFDIKENPTSHGWKFLKAEYLRESIGGDASTYKRVREALEYEHPLHGKLLECDYKHVAGVKSYGHRITREVLLKGIVAYKLKSKTVQQQWYHNQMLSYARAMQNPIAKNLILMYPHLELPTLEEIHVEAKRLVKIGFRTKKQKILTFLNKHTKTYFKNHEQRSFVEDAIEIYDYLVLKNGLMIPQPSEDAGGRVFDSLNLMPSWIRNLVKYKGQPLVELDYQCLHPNIACSLYGGTSEYLRHQNLADELNIDVLAVKTEHLSFFNKKVPQMIQSPLFQYYQQKEPIMMQNIINDKIYNTEYKYKSDKHKITSKRMFKLEVDIMTSVIQKLSDKGIHVLYVFDAVYSHSNDVSTVTDIMNQTALDKGVKTTIKQ